MFDGRQSKAGETVAAKLDVPVLYLTQLLGIAFGLPIEKLGLELNLSCPNVGFEPGMCAADAVSVEKVTSATVEASTVPVFVKLSPMVAEIAPIAKSAEEAGADAITVHPRLASQGYDVPADWKEITKVKKQIGIPIIGNGDILGGLLTLLVSLAALRAGGLPKGLNILGLLVGAVGILSIIPGLTELMAGIFWLGLDQDGYRIRLNHWGGRDEPLISDWFVLRFAGDLATFKETLEGLADQRRGVPELVQKLKAIPQSFPISPEQEQNRLSKQSRSFITNIAKELRCWLFLMTCSGQINLRFY
jgi:hypothetical protein